MGVTRPITQKKHSRMDGENILILYSQIDGLLPRIMSEKSIPVPSLALIVRQSAARILQTVVDVLSVCVFGIAPKSVNAETGKNLTSPSVNKLLLPITSNKSHN